MSNGLKVNKSKEIRDYHAANPTATPAEIAAALKTNGVKVSGQFVSTVLSNARKGKGTGPRGRKPKAAAAPAPARPIKVIKVTKAKFTDSVRAIRLIDELRTVAHRLGVSVQTLLDATAAE